MPTFREDLHAGHKVPLIEADDIRDHSITTEKLADDSVVWSKLGNDVKNRINAMSSVNLSVSPKVVLKNVRTNVYVEALSYYEADSIRIKRNGIDIATGAGTSLTVVDSITPAGADNIVYTAEFTKGDDVKTIEDVLEVARPIYWGSGSTYRDADHVATARTSPEGEYNVNVGNNGDYIFFVVPNNMIISRATMNGILFPLEEPENIIVDGVAYKSYRSSNAYSVNALTIVIL